MKNSEIVNRSFQFASHIIDLNEKLNSERQYVLGKQVLRSGTSTGANVREAQRAVSRADFINKMGIALKEAEETAYWIELINFKVFRIDQQLNDQLTIITRLLVKIITTSKRNNGESQK